MTQAVRPTKSSQTIEEAGGTAFSVHADLADAESASTLCIEAEENGPLCGIVNNASLFFHDDIQSIDSDSWDAHMDVNARSPMLLIRSLNDILEGGQTACVVNVLDL